MVLPRVEPAMRVGDQAFEAIHDAIMNGDFEAGRRLQIRALAEDLGTSVMPVREAIKRLEELGLVESLPYRGAVVRAFTTDELRQVYDVRRLLEAEAARLGAGAVDDAGVRRLRTFRKASADALSAGDVVGYIEADESFLAELYTAADNAVLLESITVLWRRCRSYKLVGVRGELATGRASILLEHQDELLAAAEARDGAAAHEVTARSLQAAASRIDAAMPAGVS